MRPRRVNDLGVPPTPTPSPNELKAEIPAKLAPLLEASQSETPQWIVYRGGSKGRSKRRITPLGFYSRDGRTFLRAWCHLDEAAKSFRADRITISSDVP